MSAVRVMDGWTDWVHSEVGVVGGVWGVVGGVGGVVNEERLIVDGYISLGRRLAYC